MKTLKGWDVIVDVWKYTSYLDTSTHRWGIKYEGDTVLTKYGPVFEIDVWEAQECPVEPVQQGSGVSR